MGWFYEYLGEDLCDQLVEHLRTEQFVLDRETQCRVFDGGSRPETGIFDGKVQYGNEWHNIQYMIRRAPPADGFDYSDYEPEYEVILLTIDGENISPHKYFDCSVCKLRDQCQFDSDECPIRRVAQYLWAIEINLGSIKPVQLQEQVAQRILLSYENVICALNLIYDSGKLIVSRGTE